MSKDELRIANCELGIGKGELGIGKGEGRIGKGDKRIAKGESGNPKCRIPDPDIVLTRALARGRALIPYLTACDPSYEVSLQAALGAVEGGAAALEIGIPFSDPVADGPVIQAAHQRALAAGGGPSRTLEFLRDLRRSCDVPVVLFTYLNPVLAFGPERLARAAREAGARALLLLDLPPGEEPGLRDLFSREGLACVPIVTPNTAESRLPEVLHGAGGFVYLVSRAGVTGTHSGAADRLEVRVAALRRHAALPVAVGFGVKSAADVEAIWHCAEAAVVGSALVDLLARTPAGQVRAAAKAFVEDLLSSMNPPDHPRSLP